MQLNTCRCDSVTKRAPGKKNETAFVSHTTSIQGNRPFKNGHQPIFGITGLLFQRFESYCDYFMLEKYL